MKSYSALARIALPIFIVVAASAQYGCSDTSTAPTGPARTNVSEAINAPGDAGAPEIVFLAPLGPKRQPRGVLDTTLTP